MRELSTFALDNVEDGVLLIENGTIVFINKSLHRLSCTTFRTKISPNEWYGLSISQLDIFGDEEETKLLENMIERAWKENKEEHHVFRFYEDNGATKVDVIADCIPHSKDSLCCIFHPQRKFNEEDLQCKLDRLEILEVLLHKLCIVDFLPRNSIKFVHWNGVLTNYMMN
jgi:hypothetical protein